MQDYQTLEVLSQSNNSQVMKMLRTTDNKIVVCKKIKYSKMTQKQKQHIIHEVNILNKLRSQNIVKYLDHFIDKNTFEIFIITQYCEGGDLESFLNSAKKNGTTIPEESIWKIFMQVVSALQQIHNRKQEKIIHRDIKPANIFLDAEQNVKLGDFGLAKRLNNQQNLAMTRMIDTYYLSPEQLKDEVFTQKTDIWAAGCLLYQIAALNFPFQGSNQIQVSMKIKSGHLEPIPSKYSKQLSRVIKWCLLQNPSERPSSQDLIHIPAIQKLIRSKRLSQNMTILNYRQKQLIKKQKQLQQRSLMLIQKQRSLSDAYNTIRPNTSRLPFKQLDNLL